MKTNLKRLTLVMMTIAMFFTIATTASAAEIPTLYDDDIFLWDDENPLAVIEFFEGLDALLGTTNIENEDVPLSDAPANVTLPVLYDDDLFIWDDENPLAVIEFFENLDALLDTTSIENEEVPLADAPANVTLPVLYDDDLFIWDDTNPFAVADLIESLLSA